MRLHDFRVGDDDVWWYWPDREESNRQQGCAVGSGGPNKGPGEVTSVTGTGQNEGKVKVRWDNWHGWIVPRHLSHGEYRPATGGAATEAPAGA
jgi:hypothetical protein